LSEKQFQKIADALLAITVLTIILTAKFNSIWLGMLAGIAMAFVGICSHNYLHQRDNWRMYCMNLTGYNYREWRVAHAMSHHMFPNSLHDVEVSNVEPMLQWLPRYKSRGYRIMSGVLCPFVWLLSIHLALLKR
jgi:hypothetical protein